jgi:hypothetical protein
MFHLYFRICAVGATLLALGGCGLGWSASPFSQKITIGSVSHSDVSTDSVVIMWATDVKSTSQVEYGTGQSYGSKTAESSQMVTSHSVVIERGLRHKTQYHYRVISKDEDGNQEVSEDRTFTTEELTISSLSASDITGGGAVISWSTNVPSTSKVEYGIDTNYGSIADKGSETSTQHQVALSGLQAGTTYHYRVVSEDKSNNVSSSADNVFTTLATSSDLYINYLSLSNTQPFIGEPVVILAVLENKGDVALSDVEIRFFDNDVLLGSDVIEQVNANSPIVRLYNLSFSSQGDHLLKIVIDPENRTSETDESNNTRYLSFTVVSF